MAEHIWESEPRFAKYCTPYRCTVCQCKRWYSWSPGWPGGYEYYLNGNKLDSEPKCVEYPKDGLFDKFNK